MVRMTRYVMVVVVPVIGVSFAGVLVTVAGSRGIRWAHVCRRQERQHPVHQESDERKDRNQPDQIGDSPGERVRGARDFLDRQAW
jgi:hypothetical protein